MWKTLWKKYDKRHLLFGKWLLHLQHICRTKVTQQSNKPNNMNVELSVEFINRAKRCVFELENRTHFYKTTGTHFSTLQRMFERGWGHHEVVEEVEKYCDAVEGLTTVNAAD